MSVQENYFGGEEEARRHLARVLHDDHSQRVTALGLELRAVRNTLDGRDPSRLQLDELVVELATLGQDLRQLSHDLHPAILEREGLRAALQAACRKTEQRYGLETELVAQGLDRWIAPKVALAIYRIAQESLANSARHGKAHKVLLEMRVANTVRLTVTDDGKGFAPAAARQQGGLGLTTMEERALLLGGRCTITSSPQGGTTVEAVIPRRKLSRWLRLRQRWLLAILLIVLTLGLGLATTYYQARQTAAEAQRSDAVVQFLERLFAAADPRQNPGEFPDARELLRRGSARLDTELADEPLLRSRLLDTLGGIYTNLGLYDEARSRLDEALVLRRRLLGAQHPEVAATLTRLGSLAHLSGQGDAVELFQQALAIRQARARTDPAELADLFNKLGVALGGQGRFDESQAMLYQSLELHEKLYGPESLQVAKTLHNLSGVAYYRAVPDDAIALLQRSLAIRESRLDEDDLDLAGSREALALMLQRQGRLAEAEALLKPLLTTVERVYGEDHPEVARILLNLGLVRTELGEEAAARALFDRALDIQERTLAPNQRMLIRTLEAMAELHRKHGRYGEAEALYRRLLEAYEQGIVYDSWDQVLAHWEELQAERAARREEPSKAPSRD
ncbi:MAG: tetratricopeptide repeat protein [Acidobacteriota bacterium]|nr:tetratricopeptide repeat protein [Acidobacteriota bacterium]